MLPLLAPTMTSVAEIVLVKLFFALVLSFSMPITRETLIQIDAMLSSTVIFRE